MGFARYRIREVSVRLAGRVRDGFVGRGLPGRVSGRVSGRRRVLGRRRVFRGVSLGRRDGVVPGRVEEELELLVRWRAVEVLVRRRVAEGRRAARLVRRRAALAAMVVAAVPARREELERGEEGAVEVEVVEEVVERAE